MGNNCKSKARFANAPHMLGSPPSSITRTGRPFKPQSSMQPPGSDFPPLQTPILESSVIENQHKFHLTPWGLSLISIHYIQYGLLFSNVKASEQLIDKLKESLSSALSHFYPLAGRMKTEVKDDGVFIYVDFSAWEGVEFIHAVATDVKAADLTHDEETLTVQKLFPLNGAVSYEGHSLPLLSVQVTELADGIFVGCSFNHAVGDGTSFVNFLTAWSQIYKNEFQVRLLESIERFSINENLMKLPIKLPFKDPKDFVDRLSPQPQVIEKIFHLSSGCMAKLKRKANQEIDADCNHVSSYQALCSLLWRCVTRARGLLGGEKTSCYVSANNRPRLSPPLPDEYIGCCADVVVASSTVSDLLGHSLGHGAMLVHQSIKAHTNESIQRALKEWIESPRICQPNKYDQQGILIGSSPRFDLYGCDFGWGRAVAVRRGEASRFDGKVAMFMDSDGNGSVHLELNLKRETMAVVESDEEFMSLLDH